MPKLIRELFIKVSLHEDCSLDGAATTRALARLCSLTKRGDLAKHGRLDSWSDDIVNAAVMDSLPNY